MNLLQDTAPKARTAPQAPTTPMVSFNTTRFGTLTVAEDKVISFVQPMPGFERHRRFILIDHDSEGVFRWLQSVDDPSVAFLLTDPASYKDGYSVPLKRSEIERLGITRPESAITLVTVCVARDGGRVSINLKGPIVFNSENMRAAQCVIDRDDYPSHFYIK